MSECDGVYEAKRTHLTQIENNKFDRMPEDIFFSTDKCFVIKP